MIGKGNKDEQKLVIIKRQVMIRTSQRTIQKMKKYSLLETYQEKIWIEQYTPRSERFFNFAELYGNGGGYKIRCQSGDIE